MLLDVGVGAHEGRLPVDQPAITGEHARLVNPKAVLVVLEDKAVRAGGHHGPALAAVDRRVSGPETNQPVAGKMEGAPGVRRLTVAAGRGVRLANCICLFHAEGSCSRASALTLPHIVARAGP